MTLPNFLIIGAAKSGTTALHSYLAQHPQVFMPSTKETNFFAFEGQSLNFNGKLASGYRQGIVTTLTDYSAQFDAVTTETAIGEACPSYLYSTAAPERIQHYVPHAKLIAILRNPVDRAYSNFLHHIRDRLETCQQFPEALAIESDRINDNWWWGFHYTQVGLYSAQIERYLSCFDRSQIKIYLYEDLQEKPDAVMKELFAFLDVDSDFELEMSARPNATGISQNQALDYLIKESNPLKSVYQAILPASLRRGLTERIQALNPKVKPNLSRELRVSLVDTFRNDIVALERLLDRDLSAWLEYT